MGSPLGRHLWMPPPLDVTAVRAALPATETVDLLKVDLDIGDADVLAAALAVWLAQLV